MITRVGCDSGARSSARAVDLTTTDECVGWYPVHVLSIMLLATLSLLRQSLQLSEMKHISLCGGAHEISVEDNMPDLLIL